MGETAFWRRLDTPGHDAATLERIGTGWLLSGTAVFRHDAGPASVNYAVNLTSDWITRRGTVRGFLAGTPFDHVIERHTDGWTINGARIDGLTDVVDLDCGFTPATNLSLLRRVAPTVGQAFDATVAWFDLDDPTLTELPQHYERRDPLSYWYRSPAGPYEATLAFAPSGFVRVYPGLWEMEA